jgi:hypothetical protein
MAHEDKQIHDTWQDSVKHIHTITCVNGEGIQKIVYHQLKWTSEQKDNQIYIMLNKLPLSSKTYREVNFIHCIELIW